jgi:septum site-determining protein MinD
LTLEYTFNHLVKHPPYFSGFKLFYGIVESMNSVTFVVSKGGVGKSLMTANVGVALAKRGKKVVLVEGDPNQPLEKILNVKFSAGDPKLDDVITKDAKINEAIHSTAFPNLFLLPSDVSLQSYFEIDPIRFAFKLLDLKSDFIFIDVPFPLGKAAMLSLGVCQYFIPILTEDEFALCVESAIDTIRLSNFLFKSIPIGFVLNRIKTPSKFDEDFLKDLEDLLEIPCITQIIEDPKVSKSYGEVGSKKAFLAYSEFPDSEFSKSVDEIVTVLIRELPKPEKKDVIKLLQEITRPSIF